MHARARMHVRVHVHSLSWHPGMWVCTYVYLHVWIHARAHVCVRIVPAGNSVCIRVPTRVCTVYVLCTSVHACTYMRVCMHVHTEGSPVYIPHTHIQTYTHTHTKTRAALHPALHTHTHIHTYAQTHTHTHTHTYTHTHTHTHRDENGPSSRVQSTQ